jgi:integrase
MTPANLPNLAEFLERWITTRKGLKKNSRRAYASHICLYLIPHLGHHRIDRLQARHIEDMFAAIAERNEMITDYRASRNPKIRDQVKGMRRVEINTMHRIRATLRSALTDAVKVQHLITINEATLLKLDPERPPKPMVWTKARVKAWRETGAIPSRVMVWTPEHTGQFLDHVQAADDRLYAIYHLIAYTGLRRGEACGVKWAEVDLDEATLNVTWQIVQLGWTAEGDTPKTADSDNFSALDSGTVAALHAHHARQLRERLAAGEKWVHSGYAFTTETGGPLHPATVTDHFRELTAQAGLPPVRLHDLRHGTATIGVAAGLPMKIVSRNLRHSSTAFTDKRYGHIYDELLHEAANKTAAVIPRRTAAGQREYLY